MSAAFKKRDYRPPQLPIPRSLVEGDRASKLAEFIVKGGSLVCEIGCGVGLHPLMYALKNPHVRVIAIERTKEKYEKFQRRYENHDVPQNLFPVHADAEAVFNHFLPKDALDELFLMYPNPEKQNPARRWIRMPFFEHILQKMKRNGKIIFVTNEKTYFEELKAVNYQIWKMNIILEKQFSIADDPFFQPRTHFEKKYFISGQTINEIHFCKGVEDAD